MIILLTNDDGVESPGIEALSSALSAEHEVWTVAPDLERSGSSHCISIKNPVKFKELGARRFACGGTPADCVLFSALGAIPVKPDVVISGINLGPNIGTDIIYSGTAAAARQAALMGIPSVAISQATFKAPFYFDRAALFLRENLSIFMDLWHPDHFININVPNLESDSLEARITHPSRRDYKDELSHFKSPSGDMYYFLSGTIDTDEGDDTDAEAVEQGFVSISPVYLHPHNHKEDEAYRRQEFKSV